MASLMMQQPPQPVTNGAIITSQPSSQPKLLMDFSHCPEQTFSHCPDANHGSHPSLHPGFQCLSLHPLLLLLLQEHGKGQELVISTSHAWDLQKKQQQLPHAAICKDLAAHTAAGSNDVAAQLSNWWSLQAACRC